MSDNPKLAKLTCLMVSLFDVDAGSVDEAIEAEDIESWDSLGHLQLVMEIEQQFGVRFSSEQIPTLTSVVAILDALDSA